MPQPAYKLRSTSDSPAIYDPARLDEVTRVVRAPRIDDTGDDPYRYGWRERWEKTPDGSEKLRVIPLTYEDTLNPQLGDRVSHDSIHSKMTRNVSGILERRYEDEPTVAVWTDLKVRTPSHRKEEGKPRKKDAPEGAKGPSPDVCVMGDVRERGRRRESFELEKEPGDIWLAVEVVSKDSARKDYKDILGPYTQLKVQEYVAIDPRGDFLDGPVKLRGWRRNPGTKRLRRVPLDKEGRFHSETTGVLFGTGAGGRGLEIRDAATGELLRPEAEARRQAEERAEQAEERVEQGLRRGVEDLCAVLGLAWGAERSAQVELMSVPQLEALREHLVNEKSWPEPEPFSDTQP
ncbi:MAG: Uma2 family endonuclease [bacterium]|nr:Uma2 family endonuclease [bacterium]